MTLGGRVFGTFSCCGYCCCCSDPKILTLALLSDFIFSYSNWESTWICVQRFYFQLVKYAIYELLIVSFAYCIILDSFTCLCVSFGLCWYLSPFCHYYISSFFFGKSRFINFSCDATLICLRRHWVLAMYSFHFLWLIPYLILV